METFISLWPVWTYIIGIPISIAICEKYDEGPYPFFYGCVWPLLIFIFIMWLILYPFYWITKKLLNYF